MISLKCFIHKTNKKISYPSPVIIEPLMSTNIGPLKLTTNELRAGEIILMCYNNKELTSIYKIDHLELVQIFGSPLCTEDKHIAQCDLYDKKTYISGIIFDIYRKIPLNELIDNKNDLCDLEGELMKYYLVSKSVEKIDKRRIRSICFKNCKNVKIAEKIYNLLNRLTLAFPIERQINVELDFVNLTVQYIHD